MSHGHSAQNGGLHAVSWVPGTGKTLTKREGQSEGGRRREKWRKTQNLELKAFPCGALGAGLLRSAESDPGTEHSFSL